MTSAERAVIEAAVKHLEPHEVRTADATQRRRRRDGRRGYRRMPTAAR